MNRHIPNILTISRFFLAPIFYYFAVQPTFYSKAVALSLFLLASFTDFLDGKIARQFDIRSKFGNFADPLADKILVMTALLSFAQVENLLIPLWLIIVIFVRETLVTILRIKFINKNKSMNTAFLGKLKTSFQMVSILIILSLQIAAEKLVFFKEAFNSETGSALIKYTPLTLILICALITVISGLQYAKAMPCLSKSPGDKS